MKKYATVLPALALAAVFSLPGVVEAQRTSAFSATLRGGAALPTSDFGEEVDTGWGFSGDVQFAFHPRVGVYAGYNWHDFDGEGDSEASISSQGWNGGLQLILVPRDGVLPWARAGVVYMKLDGDDDTGDFETDTELGFEAAIGLDWPLGDVLTFVPMIRYVGYEVDLDPGTSGGNFDITYLTIEAGLKFNFGSVGM